MGFIALAALIFGKWHPVGILFSTLLFGFASALAIQLQGSEILPAVLVQAFPYVVTVLVLAGFIGKSRPRPPWASPTRSRREAAPGGGGASGGSRPGRRAPPRFPEKRSPGGAPPPPLGEAGVGVRPEVEEALLKEDLGLRPLAVEDQAAHLLGEGLRLPHGAKVSSAGRP